ncbi:MAG: pentapeptide repeat-containing protein [Saprospiraceae bacterium]|nr:pentapeptide repeat-containing protein [Saprospiraceae bacterium]
MKSAQSFPTSSSKAANELTNHITGLDLIGAKITGLDLIGAKITGLDLIGAKITGLDLIGA